MTERRAIVFDLDGTLLELQGVYDEILTATFRTVESEVRPAWVEQYTERFHELFSACELNPVRGAFASIDVRAEPDCLADELREREAAAYRPPDGTYEALERLGRAYAVGVLTNGMPDWQEFKLHTHDLDQYVETVVSSYEAGAHKPDPAPYLLAERRLPASEYAMVGDSADDVEGARQVGWTAYRYTGGGFGDLPDALDW